LGGYGDRGKYRRHRGLARAYALKLVTGDDAAGDEPLD
jgi:hypothetical protein